MMNEVEFRRGGRARRVLSALAASVVVGISALAQVDIERALGFNAVHPHEPFEMSAEARELHQSLIVADWHTDTLLWLRDPLDPSDIGQVDVPRLKEANMAVQVFTSVTRVPSGGTNFQGNTDEGDLVGAIATGDNWPEETHDSLFERSAYHADRLADAESRAPDQVKLILNASDLAYVLEGAPKVRPSLARCSERRDFTRSKEG